MFFVCVSLFIFQWNSDLWFGFLASFVINDHRGCFSLSLFSKILSHYSLTLVFFSSILFGLTSSIVFFCLFFCLFGYMICSVVIVIFAASPPFWKPSDFNVRLCLAFLDFSLYLYNSFMPRTTLTYSAVSSLLPVCLSRLLWAFFCSGHSSVGLPGSDLLHSGGDSGYTRQSSGKASGVRS